MKNNKQFKDLSTQQRLKGSEKLGSKVAIIINKAMERCNKILLVTGHGINLNVEFYRLDQEPINVDKEVVSTNG